MRRGPGDGKGFAVSFAGAEGDVVFRHQRFGHCAGGVTLGLEGRTRGQRE
jgi:hypothetical protein